MKADIPNRTKCDFIKSVRNKDLAPTIELASLIRPILLSGEVSVKDVSPRLLVLIIAKAPEDERETLGGRAILSTAFNNEVIKMVLNAMGGDYKKLVNNKSKTSTISYSFYSIRIVNYLANVGLLKDSVRKGNYIVVEKMV